ncbi:MAG: FGGY-family carbohydrate kinase, partial [Pseudomonadota bacterium]
DHLLDVAAGTRAVLEGVTHAIRDSFDALSATDTRIERLIAVGGGSRSEYWLRAIATSLDMPVEVPVGGDFGAAFGAARLGMMAATGAGREIAAPPAMDRIVRPDRALVRAFADAHARYRATYNALKDLS